MSGWLLGMISATGSLEPSDLITGSALTGGRAKFQAGGNFSFATSL